MKNLVLFTALVLTLSVASFGSGEKPKANTALGAKLYGIYCISANTGGSYLLEGVEAVDFEGIKCLKGRHADTTWVKGRTCYIPVDKIVLIVEYDSLEQYKQNLREAREAQLK